MPHEQPHIRAAWNQGVDTDIVGRVAQVVVINFQDPVADPQVAVSRSSVGLDLFGKKNESKNLNRTFYGP